MALVALREACAQGPRRSHPAGRSVFQIAFHHQIAASLGYDQEARPGIKAAGDVIVMRQ